MFSLLSALLRRRRTTRSARTEGRFLWRRLIPKRASLFEFWLVDELGGFGVALAKGGARWLASPLALFPYAREGFEQLARGRALYLCPLVRAE